MLAYVVATALVVIFLSYILSSDHDVLGTGDKIASVMSLLIAVATFVAGYAVSRSGGSSDAAAQLDLARTELVSRLSREWSAEAFARGLSNPHPLKVRWTSTQLPVAAAPAEIVNSPAGRPVRLKFHGDVTTIAEAFRQLPARQLVVIGRPEAGKTSLAVLLVRSLLADWQPDEPVPLMLNVSGWDPTKVHLDTWISTYLQELYPWLDDTGRYGSRVPAQLVENRTLGILPILDGLDELPSPLRYAAILALNEVIGGDRQLVLTCRSDEYEAAVIAAGVPLARAAVIDIQPVTPAEAGIYLPLAQRDGRRRWAPVVEHLQANPRGPLATALSTPLMVYLARTAYTTRDPRPLTMFSDVDAVSEHLLREYLPALYGPRLPDRDADAAAKYHCTAEQAGQWLGFLARHLRQQTTDNLAWWNLSAASPQWLVGMTCGTAAAIVSALLLPTPIVRQGVAVFAGLGLGLVVALGCGLLMRMWIPPAKASLVRGLAGGILGSLMGAIVALILFGAGPDNVFLGSYMGAGIGVGIVVAALRGIVVGLVAGFIGEIVITVYEHADTFQDVRIAVGGWARIVNSIGLGLAVGVAVRLANRSAPARGTRWSPLGFASGLAVGVAIGFSIWVQSHTLGSILVWIVASLIAAYAGGVFFEGAPADIAKATTPRSVLVRDRATFRACGVVVGLVGFGLGLTFGFANPGGIQVGLGAGLAVGLVNMAAGGLAFAFNQASWGSYVVSRSWLAVRRRLPWRLMAFLEDAHQPKGVLRQVGAEYQFRHARLRDYIARSG